MTTGAGPATANVCPECGQTSVYSIWHYDGIPLPTPCPDCAARLEIARDAAAKESEHQKRVHLWRNLEIPFQDTDRDLLPAKNAPLVLSWAYSRGSLIVTGPTGMGKTRTMVELMHDLFVRDGFGCQFIGFTAWKQALDKAHRYGGDGVEKFVLPYRKVPVLFIDDVGHGRLNENNLSCLFELIDSRTSSRRVTLLTTQHDKESLRKAFNQVSEMTGEAMLRRMEQFFRHVAFDEAKPLPDLI